MQWQILIYDQCNIVLYVVYHKIVSMLRQEEVIIFLFFCSSETTKKKKSRRKRNAAIESILDLKNNSALGSEAGAASSNTPSSTPLAAGPSSITCESTTVHKAPISSGLTNGGGRGRGRFYADKSRKNISMIRPECIHGYDAKHDYDPNDLGAQQKNPLDPSGFPPL